MTDEKKVTQPQVPVKTPVPVQPPVQPKLQPYQERVVAEKKDLDDRLAKLLLFFNTKEFPALPLVENQRLQLQAAVMEEYSEILGERISDFGGK